MFVDVNFPLINVDYYIKTTQILHFRIFSFYLFNQNVIGKDIK